MGPPDPYDYWIFNSDQPNLSRPALNIESEWAHPICMATEYSIPISLTYPQLHWILNVEWAHLISPIIEYSIPIRQIQLICCLNIGSEYEGEGEGLLSVPLYNTNTLINWQSARSDSIGMQYYVSDKRTRIIPWLNIVWRSQWSHFTVIFDSLNLTYMQDKGGDFCRYYFNMCTKLETLTILFLFLK